MPIKNYTTKVDVFISVGEIQSALAKGGANKVMVDYDNGVPVAVTFSIPTSRGTQGFALPAPVEGTLRVFARQKIKADRQQAEADCDCLYADRPYRLGFCADGVGAGRSHAHGRTDYRAGHVLYADGRVPPYP